MCDHRTLVVRTHPFLRDILVLPKTFAESVLISQKINSSTVILLQPKGLKYCTAKFYWVLLGDLCDVALQLHLCVFMVATFTSDNVGSLHVRQKPSSFLSWRRPDLIR